MKNNQKAFFANISDGRARFLERRNPQMQNQAERLRLSMAGVEEYRWKRLMALRYFSYLPLLNTPRTPVLMLSVISFRLSVPSFQLSEMLRTPQHERNRLPESGSQFRNRSDNYFTLYRAFRNVPILTICPSFNKSAITRSTVVALMSGSRCRISDLETGTKLVNITREPAENRL